MSERIEVVVSGRVQRVMYRDFAQRKGSGLKLTGTVRNRSDKTVHVVAEGPRQKLEAYLEKLKKGPLLAHVDGVECTWTTPTGEFTSFTISYD